MSYYQTKVVISRNKKLKKENYIIKADSVITADTLTVINLSGFDPDVVITDVNLKGYVAVYMLEDGDGPLYQVDIEFDEADGKVVREPYLQQANSTKEAETLLMANLGNPAVEITNTKKTNIVDYFEQEEV
jgi:hypothetical protein